MGNVSEWATTAGGNNTGTPPDFPVEGMAPSAVNDTMREMMAALARWYGDVQGALTTGGLNNAYTLTTNSGHAALSDQSVLVFRADRANTGAVTLQVDGLTAKAVQKNGGDALVAGDIQAGQIIAVAYDATSGVYKLVGDALVTTTSLADGALAATAEGRAKMADGFLAADATGRAKMQDSYVTTAKLADSNVTTAKLADLNVTTAKLATGEQMTTTNVLAKTAGAGVGAVGTYAFLVPSDAVADVNPGNTRAGSGLRYTSGNGSGGNGPHDIGTAPTGTWRAMGYSPVHTSGGDDWIHATLWLRIS
jgi:hypothetical protein